MVNRVKSVPMRFRASNFGITILAHRLELGMSQEAIGKLVNVSGSCVCDYEQGNEDNPKMKNFLAFCNLFDLDPRDYFELES